MKTAVSIPDEVFEAAERLVEKLQTSRSQLYAKALVEFLARHDENKITSAMNQVMDSLDEPVEPFVREAGNQALKRVEW
jgi:metal-responsive CopG/Arc/MetJ family transcriptional regulator